MRGRRRQATALAVSLVTLLPTALSSATSPRGDPALLRVLARQLPRATVAGAAAAAGKGSPEAIQAQYDAARDLQEALEAGSPVSTGCEDLFLAAERLARGEIAQAEGVDRPSRSLLAAGVRQVAAAEQDLKGLPRACSRGPLAVGTPRKPELDEPRSGEAFPGLVRSPVPAETNVVDISIDGRVVGKATPRRGRATTYLVGKHGRWNVSFRYRRDSRLLGVAESRSTWLLPRTARKHVAARVHERKLAAQLALLASGFEGHAGIWVHDLSSGATAGWNEDARFPAASTVKLAVLIAALRRFGPRPGETPVAYDLRTLAAWSSNLAANRLLRKLGGSEAAGSRIAQATLERLGASSSSYTGDYRVGTAIGGVTGAAGAPDPPPLVSQRVTTARDLGRILFLVHSAAMRDRTALKRTGLSVHQARVGLALLLGSQPSGDNLGLFRPNLDPSVPIAQKNGWLNDARHTAAIVYGKLGPTIVVLLTYRPAITRPEAAALAAKTLKFAGVG